MKKILLFAIFMSLFSTTAQALSKEEVDEGLATLINLKGYLCAKVVNVRPLSQTNIYEVKCIEYRGGQGTVDYIVKVDEGIVYPR